MAFIALVFALLIEQGRPLPERNFIHHAIARASEAVHRATNAGERQNGVLGWSLIIGSLCALVVALQWLAQWLHPVAVFCLHVAVLYLTIGFRQFSHAFTEVQLALAAGDLAGARRVLATWIHRDAAQAQFADASVSDVCRTTIAHALLASHRHVFGPLIWYVLLPGAVGPVLYRVADMLARRWAQADEPYAWWPRIAFRWIDWLPLRMTAVGFAIVGNFEDAVYAWRGAVAAGTGDDGRALLLASGGGALGLRIADPALEARWAAHEQGYEPAGIEPGPESLRSAVGLVWRSVVLWISLFAMLNAANWLGR
jgi:adenosylcobinamide-phosphate synthase